MYGINIKEKIRRNVKNAIREFEAREDIVTRFGEPVIGYADARDPLFDVIYYKGLSKHPKEVYRPGNTVVLHFVPFAEEVVQSNEVDGRPSEQWSRAFTESMWLSMRLNGVIRETLDTIGRLSSCTNTPADWNEEICHEEWSHKMAAYVAGMGEFGPAGSFRTEQGFAGRISSVITDGVYGLIPEERKGDDRQTAEEKQTPDGGNHAVEQPIDGEALYAAIMAQCRYEGAEGICCSEKMIKACPGRAITQKGIDRKACQAYCKTLNERIPSPEVCGKCFGF